MTAMPSNATPAATPEHTWLSTSDAAAYLGVTRWTLRRLVRRGELPAYADPLDRRVRWYAQADLDNMQRLESVAL